MSMINKLEIGQKDLNTSLFTVWTEIFQLPKNQKLVSTICFFFVTKFILLYVYKKYLKV